MSPFRISFNRSAYLAGRKEVWNVSRLHKGKYRTYTVEGFVADLPTGTNDDEPGALVGKGYGYWLETHKGRVVLYLTQRKGLSLKQVF